MMFIYIFSENVSASSVDYDGQLNVSNTSKLISVTPTEAATKHFGQETELTSTLSTTNNILQTTSNPQPSEGHFSSADEIPSHTSEMVSTAGNTSYVTQHRASKMLTHLCKIHSCCQTTY